MSQILKEKSLKASPLRHFSRFPDAMTLLTRHVPAVARRVYD